MRERERALAAMVEAEAAAATDRLRAHMEAASVLRVVGTEEAQAERARRLHCVGFLLARLFPGKTLTREALADLVGDERRALAAALDGCAEYDRAPHLRRSVLDWDRYPRGPAGNGPEDTEDSR